MSASPRTFRHQLEARSACVGAVALWTLERAGSFVVFRMTFTGIIEHLAAREAIANMGVANSTIAWHIVPGGLLPSWGGAF